MDELSRLLLAVTRAVDELARAAADNELLRSEAGQLADITALVSGQLECVLADLERRADLVAA